MENQDEELFPRIQVKSSFTCKACDAIIIENIFICNPDDKGQINEDELEVIKETLYIYLTDLNKEYCPKCACTSFDFNHKTVGGVFYRSDELLY